MKFKSYKNWATVFCAAAVFSLISLRDAQAAGYSRGIMPPPPIDNTVTAISSVRILPPPAIDDDVTKGEQLNGDFSGTVMVD